MQMDQGGKSGLEITLGTSLQDLELHPLRACRSLQVS
jgi:hypothetical protein